MQSLQSNFDAAHVCSWLSHDRGWITTALKAFVADVLILLLMTWSHRFWSIGWKPIAGDVAAQKKQQLMRCGWCRWCLIAALQSRIETSNQQVAKVASLIQLTFTAWITEWDLSSNVVEFGLRIGIESNCSIAAQVASVVSSGTGQSASILQLSRASETLVKYYSRHTTTGR